MRVWDVHPRRLCRRHLLGEHRELHAIWSILTKGRKGYSRHPETLRWKGRLRALYSRHTVLVAEMGRRGYNERTPLNKRLATGKARQDVFVDSPRKQLEILRKKKCDCRV